MGVEAHCLKDHTTHFRVRSRARTIAVIVCSVASLLSPLCCHSWWPRRGQEGSSKSLHSLALLRIAVLWFSRMLVHGHSQLVFTEIWLEEMQFFSWFLDIAKLRKYEPEVPKSLRYRKLQVALSHFYATFYIIAIFFSPLIICGQKKGPFSHLCA